MSTFERVVDAPQAWFDRHPIVPLAADSSADVRTERASSCPGRAAEREKIRFVCATRRSLVDFLRDGTPERRLALYRNLPQHQRIELRLFENNHYGLASVYLAIDDAAKDPAILVFIHDDVFLNDYHWSSHFQDALQSLDVVGIVGNMRRVPAQACWKYLNDSFISDSYDNLSGVIGHGEGFPSATRRQPT